MHQIIKSNNIITSTSTSTNTKISETGRYIYIYVKHATTTASFSVGKKKDLIFSIFYWNNLKQNDFTPTKSKNWSVISG